MRPQADVPVVNVRTILERGAANHGEREALAWGDDRVTYERLDALTGALAASLAEHGAAPGDRVALLGRNDVDYALALLGILRGGFVAVPLNWRLSPDAVAATAAKFSPSTILYAEEFAAIAETIAPAERRLELATARSAAEERRAPALAGPPLARDQLAAIISTGGTEGTPKGVEVTHGSIEACAISLLCSDHLSSDDVQLVLPQMFHNPQLYVVPWLLVGAKLVIPQMTSFDPELLLRTIAAEGVTHFLGVATMMTYLRDAQERLQVDLSSLKVVAYGGAPFAPATLERLMATFACDFRGTYGQTETAVVVSVLEPADHRAALSDDRLRHRLASAGRPVALMEVKLVDDEGRVCPRDRRTVGEIVARGPSVMQRYWEAPELTAEKLRGGWCWTGDLATWDEDGYLYIVDRRRDMIISGGENVYAKAVETVIYEHPAVHEVVVVGSPDPEWGEVVTAVIVAEAGAQLTAGEVVELCGSRLARYMRPRRVEFVDELPKNASGKILKAEVRGWYRADEHDGLARH
jgi:acyl-CoA synthetase (AMP-forming)/AMP-acid ligase II